MLWAYRTTKSSSTRETPVVIVYDTKAVIPTEIGLPTLRSEIADRLEINQN